MDTKRKRSPWQWVPSLYFSEGIPYIIVNTVSMLIFKQLGMSNDLIAFFTSFLMFPWVLKPLWTPVVDIYGTKKRWVLGTQFGMGVLFALAVFAMPLAFAVQLLLIIFIFLAIFSATHDAAADGFYIVSLEPEQQAFFTGVRSTFYRISMVVAQGGVVLLAGLVQQATGIEKLEFEISGKADTVQVAAFENADVGVSVAGVWYQDKFDALDASVTAYNLNVSPADEWEIPSSDSADAIIYGVVLSLDLKTPLNGSPRQLVMASISGSDLKVVNGDRLIFNPEFEGKPLLVILKTNKGAEEIYAGVTVQGGNFILAWMVALGAMAALYLVLPLYHKFAMPLERTSQSKVSSLNEFFHEFGEAFVSFFKKDKIVIILMFILLYRFAESQLLKIGSLFLVDSTVKGGLGLSNSEYGIAYGTFGVLSLLVGGIVGGWALSRKGLRYWMLPMALALNLSDLAYVYLATVLPESMVAITLAIIFEQLGYGFGFAAYMLFMIYVASDSGKYSTSHFAIMTGFMALGMMLPGMFAGKMQMDMFAGNYELFFWWVMVATLVSIGITLVAMRIVPHSFGRPEEKSE